MIAADAILLVAGLLLFGGATAGLVSMGGFETIVQQTSPTGLFNVTFALSTLTLAEKTVTSYASGSLNFEVTTPNMTKLKFSVLCTDPAPSGMPPYEVTVRVEGPNGTTGGPKTANCGTSLEIDIPLANPPSPGTVPGETEKEARGNLATSPNGTKALGTWKVTYSGKRATLPLQPDLAVPGGTVRLGGEEWKAKLTAIPK